MDVYTLSYVDTLSKKYLERNLLQQWLNLLFMLIMLAPRVFRALLPDRQQIRPLQKIQVLFALFILMLSVVYLIVLTVALVGTLLQVPQIATVVNPILNTPSGANPPLTLISQIIIILLAVVELFYPQFKQNFSASTVHWISAIEYINLGNGDRVVAGQLANLLEHVVETNLYRNIHIIAYSLGSIIAIDSFFPKTDTPGPRLQGVNTLVTIGCPYDVICLFWPKYFEGRSCLPHTPQRWINIYSPVDIMGSNFRDDSTTAEPNKPIQTVNDSECGLLPDKNTVYGSRKADNSSLFAALTLVGLTSHASYWQAKYQAEESAFSPIIQAIYEGDFALS